MMNGRVAHARRRLLLAAAAWPLAAPAGPLMLPPVAPLSERRLANGLQVVALPDPAAASVAIQVWYRVGGRDDPPGRSGFAHLFEHMMFKRTRHLADEAFDRLTEDVGGSNNAFTADDVTVYQDDVPPNHLERLLWAEAERMSNLTVDQANFDSERAVVKEELRERVLADPYGRLYNELPALGYLEHPYRRSPIGRIEDLDAATLDDVRDFHRLFYRPDNALLIVAGAFDGAELDRWVDRYFAPLARPDWPIPRVAVREPRRAVSRRVALHGPAVPLPALALIWQGVHGGDVDAPALKVASALLSAGDSSRLNDALVVRRRLAQSASFYAEQNVDAGLLVGLAVAAGGHTLGELEDAMRRQIERLAHEPIADGELAKVRIQMLTSALVARQTPAGRAEAAGWAVILQHDVHDAERELARLQAVSAADVQRVLRQHVLTRPAVVVRYTQSRP